MREVVDAIRHALRDDSVIEAIVGRDKDNEVKVYQGLAKSNVEAPYIVWNLIPGNQPTGAYGDDYAFQEILVQITSWGRNPHECWQLADITEEAVVKASYDVDPWTVAKVRRVNFPQELPDRDTNLTQVPVQYRFLLGREAPSVP
jgi:uncharacterized protein DUF3168